MSTIKPWLERMPGRLPLTQYACTLIQVSCMYEEINELRAENAKLREALKTLNDGCRSPTQVGVLLGLDLARAALGEKS